MQSLTIVFSTHLEDKYNRAFIDHAKKTSGLSGIEILQYKNFNMFSLTEIYNRGLKESTNDIVVFVHNDIIFERNNWGKKLLKHFNKTDYGILGVAGTTDITESCRWWDKRERMVGIVNHKSEEKKWESKYSNSYGKGIIPVVLVDGVFFAVNKKRIKSEFNEKIQGFHFYDISFSLDNYLNNVKLGVIFDIRIIHKSIGQIDQQWEDNRKQVQKIYKDKLPISTKPLDFNVLDKDIKLKENPKLTVIIPSKDNVDLLLNCLKSYNEKVKYQNYSIIVADTGSKEENLNKIEEEIKKLSNVKVRVVKYDYYNFAEINNDVVQNHVDEDSELILFCNNDIKLMNDAISRCVDVYNKNKRNVGTIGIRLHFEDKSVQHDGVELFFIVDQENQEKKYLRAGHKNLNSYYKYCDDIRRDVIGNTAAFMMINKNLFVNCGMFNENYIECFEDVELNLECIIRGKQNHYVGSAVAYHYESMTRNKDEQKNKRESVDFNDRLAPFVDQNLDKLEKYIKSFLVKM